MHNFLKPQLWCCMAVMSPTGTTFTSSMAKICIGILQTIAKYCVSLMGCYAVYGTGLQKLTKWMVSSKKDVIIRVTLLRNLQLAVCTCNTEYKCHKIIMTNKKVNKSYCKILSPPKMHRNYRIQRYSEWIIKNSNYVIVNYKLMTCYIVLLQIDKMNFWENIDQIFLQNNDMTRL